MTKATKSIIEATPWLEGDQGRPSESLGFRHKMVRGKQAVAQRRWDMARSPSGIERAAAGLEKAKGETAAIEQEMAADRARVAQERADHKEAVLAYAKKHPNVFEIRADERFPYVTVN